MYRDLARIAQLLMVLVLTAVVAHGSQKAHLAVKQLHYKNPKLNQNVEFPLILDARHSAKKINQHLQNVFLNGNGFFVDNGTIHPHEEVKLPDISYTLYPTSHTLFSVRFSLTESGEDGYLESFLFDAQAGKLVLLKDLFSAAGFAQLTGTLAVLKQKRAQQSIKHYGAKSLERETIQECADQGMKIVRFFVICNILVVEEERCSGNMHLEHDIAPYYLLPYREIVPYLSSYGKKLLGAKGCSNLHDSKTNAPTVLKEIYQSFFYNLMEIKNQTGTLLLDRIMKRYRKIR